MSPHQMSTASEGSDPCCMLILALPILLYRSFSQGTVKIVSKVFKIVSLNCQHQIEFKGLRMQILAPNYQTVPTDKHHCTSSSPR